MLKKIAFGGSCHWCTEAIFESLLGVDAVEQGWVASEDKHSAFSEGVIVAFDDAIISLEILVAIHLHTHSCTAEHSMREKYRSAVYAFTEADVALAKAAIKQLQKEFNAPIITQVLRFHSFKINREEQLHYYFSDPQRPFCETYVNPKLRLLLERFGAVADRIKLRHLKS